MKGSPVRVRASAHEKAPLMRGFLLLRAFANPAPCSWATQRATRRAGWRAERRRASPPGPAVHLTAPGRTGLVPFSARSEVADTFPVLRIIGNIIWLIFGGLVMALIYGLAGILMFILIITIPFGVQAFKLAGFTLWPFGRTLVRREGAHGALSAIGNVLWFVLAGIWLAIGHVISAVLCAITIIGIPFAVAHLKLAGASLVPFGREVVPLSAASVEERRRGVAIAPLGRSSTSGNQAAES